MEYTLNVHSKNVLLKLKNQIIPNYLYMVSRQDINYKLNTYNSFICATTSEEKMLENYIHLEIYIIFIVMILHG